MLFINTWSQYGHLVSCMTILFLCLQITKSDIRPQVKWAVNLVIADIHFNLPQGFVWVPKRVFSDRADKLTGSV